MSKQPRRRAKSAKAKHDWTIYRIGGPRAGIVGHVNATDAAEAIAKAILEFEISAADRSRLIARRDT